MCSTCSSRLPIRYACRAAALLLAAPLLVRPAPAAAQQQDEALVSELARLLAAADARAFDPPLFREALQDPLPAVRRQAALAAGAQGPAQTEAVTALANIGGDEGARAVRELLGLGPTAGVATSPVQRAALLEAWRLGARAPVPALIGYAQDPDPVARWHALYSLARLRLARGVTVLLNALQDGDPAVRAVAVRGVSRALSDSAKLDPGGVVGRIRPLLADRDPGIRINALRALATYRDAGGGAAAFAGLAAPLAADANVNVAVQAETTLGALGGARAVEALQAGGG